MVKETKPAGTWHFALRFSHGKRETVSAKAATGKETLSLGMPQLIINHFAENRFLRTKLLDSTAV